MGNDENYYYPDLARGMIVDEDHGMGIVVAAYTGSTTGTTRNNQVCSAYTPITWQVDRKCHLISASSFDKMCADMKQMRDDMSGDLHPHGARACLDKFDGRQPPGPTAVGAPEMLPQSQLLLGRQSRLSMASRELQAATLNGFLLAAADRCKGARGPCCKAPAI